MVQTASTNDAAQSQVRGATTVRVVGGLLILLGGYRLYGAINTVVLVSQRGISPSSLFLFLLLSGVIGLLGIMAGVLLVRQDRAGRGFGLVVCSIALAHQVFAFGSTLVAVSRLSSTTVQSLGVLFWLLPCAYAILFLVGIIVIARWRPPLS
jgi:hypothetical protein